MNDNKIHDTEQTPEQNAMDFYAAEKRARRVTGRRSDEWENRSAGTRNRGPSGRYEGMRSGKHHEKKPAHHDQKPEPGDLPEPVAEKILEPVVEAIPEPEVAPARALPPEPEMEAGAFSPEEMAAFLMADEPDPDEFSPVDMAAFLVENERMESGPLSDLTDALIENGRMDRDPMDDGALFAQLDAQLEPEPAPEPRTASAPAPSRPEPQPPKAAASRMIAPLEEDGFDYGDDGSGGKKRRGKGGLIVGIIAGLLCLAFFGSAFAVSKRETIYPNVTIQGEDVSSMTVAEAVAVVKSAGWDGPDETVLEVTLPADVSLDVKTRDVGWTATAAEAAQAAWDYGRDGSFLSNFFSFLRTARSGHEIADDLTGEKDPDTLRERVSEAVDEANSAMTEGNMEIDLEKKVLRMVKGGDLLMVETDDVYQQLLEALEDHSRTLNCIREVTDDDPVEELDLEALHDEICGEPENASYDVEKKEIVEGKPGVEFDVKEAQRLWDKAKPGDLVEIPLEVTEPEFKKDDVTELFADRLSMKSTSLSGSSANRINNITLAAQRINNVILEPGQTFSYNSTVGQRTTARGFREAGAYLNGEVVQEVGGGICQASSTLYYCTLYANLNITARTNHYFPVAYIGSGLDATVSWGAPDFRFENNRTFPVKLVAYVSGGNLTVEIWGTDVDGTTVKMDSTSSGLTTTTYRNVFDKDGKLLTRTQEAVSVYHNHEETRPKATPTPVTTPPPATPTPAPPEPTPEPTAEPPAPTAPEEGGE